MSEGLIEELKAIAHPLRLRILEVLREGERNVGEIEEAAQIGQPALSQQLGVLRKAGLVETRKEAKLVYYRLGEKPLTELADLLAGLVPQSESAATSTRAPSPGAANFARLS
ncbi:MAG: metalloregulator ArsR/SmtB family transcription factor [Pseudomonadota bacterium]|jgi:DNA-binding transcriptional ArsR family regulator